MFVVYTAGPYRSAQGMHGVAQNIERAGSVARQLWAMGFTVICPHKNTAFFDGADIPDEVWLAGCLQLVGRADILILLPGWEHSSGTRIERDTALAKPARARPVEGGEMGEAAHSVALAHGNHLAQRRIASHMRPMLIETESTPNPATLKFLPGRAVMEAGTRDFASPEEAEASPLATALFALGDVTGVFFGRDFVSVTIAPGAEWADAKPDVLGIVMDHFLADMPLFHPASAAGISVPGDDEGGFADDPADADIVEQIKELIETRVRPAVANDGGDIVYRGFDKGNVYLKMQGACSGCPSSTATLKNGIESLLKHYVPEVTAVHAV
ncbi:MAG: Fe/S biogenesis protein NfuA [bacterium ADurb.Bin429]|nr:MAG: Fe/S biogenesis protein NfuA [bacterium ADurb.Bin429]